ncbi:ubiquinol-cytochrome c reductase cytochrome c1 subunit [Legionella geestiana]|uniref:Ubiquinol-cytochrome c reductase cytochrome c1 subunit n=2 Tax=Legionella geestiana TaxID=45065 RepID=A0A0W0TLR2_9GAMM|nr:ubiquinol-cytochrome c reductase cytochrome c1 subunit [Legionella geestiana]STX54997.1 ubiquinol-cytochrome c reductase cytochrome c1 subunit [Legionella geestiana]
MLKRITFAALLLGIFGGGFAATSSVPLARADVDVRDTKRLQRGARVFMNYCSGCHSLKYLRYQRMGRDLGLTTFDGRPDNDLLKNNLIFTSARVNDPIRISMPPTDARQWFGVVPPDLSLVVRRRSADWVYTYLNSFYADSTRPFGTNNLLVPNVAMPNVFAPLRGRVIHVPESVTEADTRHAHLVRVGEGSMTPEQFEDTLDDLVSFLAYVAEPVQLVRYRTGVGALIFLGLFFLVVRALKKDIHKRILSAQKQETDTPR